MFESARTSALKLTVYRALALAGPIALIGIGLARKSSDLPMALAFPPTVAWEQSQ